MKKYLLTFTCIFCISALLSTFYILISRNTSTNDIVNQPNIEKKLEELPEEKSEEKIEDFTNPEIKPTIENKIIEKTLEFQMPVDSNEIGMKFSNNQLVYSQTLKEWILHNGIDIVAKAGTPVYACEEGKIIEISNTVDYGIKITIEHKNGYKTVYSNLSTEKMVKEGQSVEKGQAISGIGKTSTFEYDEKDHLHFEMYKDNQAINPLNLLSQFNTKN